MSRPALLLAFATLAACASTPTEDEVVHGFADNDGVRLHYATLGEGPLVVMLHGFPDYWYTWRDQMRALSSEYQVVAMDLRGYNRSDRPEGIDSYRMPVLVSDVAAVLDHFDRDSAIIVGHDWGGAIAWQFAMAHPQRTERLIICNVPHPNGLVRELQSNPAQQQSSTYAFRFQEEGAHEALTAEGLAGWMTDAAARQEYIAAFERSDFEAMLNYYKANFPRPGAAPARPPAPLPKISMPTLVIFGLDDQALLPASLNDTWNWVDSDLTLVTIPGAGHFVQQDASDLVTRAMVSWLRR